MATKASRENIYIAIETGWVEITGDPVPFFFREGVTKILASHPAMKQVPMFFKPFDQYAGVVEANPGGEP